MNPCTALIGFLATPPSLRILSHCSLEGLRSAHQLLLSCFRFGLGKIHDLRHRFLKIKKNKKKKNNWIFWMFSEVWGLGLFRSLLVSPSWFYQDSMFYQCSRLPEATAAAFNSLGAKWRIAPCAGIVWKNDFHNMTLLDLPYLYSYSYSAGLDKTFDSRVIGDTLKHSQVVDVYTYLQ